MSNLTPGVLSIDRGERVYTDLVSDKDTHFTDAIALDAIEYEDITGLRANKIFIRGINIQCSSALAFRFWLWDSDAHAAADLDTDTFLEFVELNMAVNGERIAGAGQYYLQATGLNIIYEDTDGTFELHCGLQIYAGAGKAASPGDYVQIDVYYTPRL